MLSTIRNLLRGSHKESEDNRYYQAQYNAKLNEIVDSFEDLKLTTHHVIDQAIEVSANLNRKVELFDKRIRTIVNNIDEIVIIKTVNNQWVAINNAACSILGIVKDSVIGKTNNEIVEIYPDLKSLIVEIDSIESKCWDTMRAGTFNVHLTKDDDLEWKLLITPIQTSDGIEKEIIIIGKRKEG